MEEKCFVNGCTSPVSIKWFLSSSITGSCSAHYILESNKLPDHRVLHSNSKLSLPSKKKQATTNFLLTTLVILCVAILCKLTLSSQENFDLISADLKDLKTHSEINYRFYSELTSLKDLVEETPQSRKIDSIVSGIKQELGVFSEKKYKSALGKREALIACSENKNKLSTKLDMLVNSIGILIEDEEGEILTVSFINSGEKLLVGSIIGTLNMFSFETHKYEKIHGGKNRVYSIAPSNDGSTVAASSGSSLNIYSSSMKPLKSFSAHDHWILTTTVSKDDQWMLTGSCDRSIKVWNFTNFQVAKSLTGHVGDIWSVAISEDNRYIVSGGEDRLLILWEFASKNILKTFTSHTAAVYSVAITHDNKKILSGSADGTIRIWNIQTLQEEHVLAHKGLVRTVEISKNNLYFLSCAGQVLKIWDLQTKSEVFTFSHIENIISASFSPDSKWVVSGDRSNRIWIWNLVQGKLQWVIGGNKMSIKGIDVTEDMKWLIIAETGMVRVWDTETLKQIQIFTEKKQLAEWKETDLARYSEYLK